MCNVYVIFITVCLQWATVRACYMPIVLFMCHFYCMYYCTLNEINGDGNGDGMRKSGRPMISWIDYIIAWTDQSGSSLLRITRDRGRWSVLVHPHSQPSLRFAK